MPAVCAGVDAEKPEHHRMRLDKSRTVLLSRRLPADENELLELIAGIDELAARRPVTRATDLNASGWCFCWRCCMPTDGRCPTSRGESCATRRDVPPAMRRRTRRTPTSSPNQPRMRTDLQPVTNAEQSSLVLRVLTSPATGPIHAINQVRATLLDHFPTFERAFDDSKNRGATPLLSSYRTALQLRRICEPRLALWLKKRPRGIRGCRHSACE